VVSFYHILIRYNLPYKLYRHHLRIERFGRVFSPRAYALKSLLLGLFVGIFCLFFRGTCRGKYPTKFSVQRFERVRRFLRVGVLKSSDESAENAMFFHSARVLQLRGEAKGRTGWFKSNRLLADAGSARGERLLLH